MEGESLPTRTSAGTLLFQFAKFNRRDGFMGTWEQRKAVRVARVYGSFGPERVEYCCQHEGWSFFSSLVVPLNLQFVTHGMDHSSPSGCSFKFDRFSIVQCSACTNLRAQQAAD